MSRTTFLLDPKLNKTAHTNKGDLKPASKAVYNCSSLGCKFKGEREILNFTMKIP